MKAPPRDESLKWPACGDCPSRHAPGAPCPRPARWLVAATCLPCRRLLKYPSPPLAMCRRHDTIWLFKGRTINGRKVT